MGQIADVGVEIHSRAGDLLADLAELEDALPDKEPYNSKAIGRAMDQLSILSARAHNQLTDCRKQVQRIRNLLATETDN